MFCQNQSCVNIQIKIQDWSKLLFGLKTELPTGPFGSRCAFKKNIFYEKGANDQKLS